MLPPAAAFEIAAGSTLFTSQPRATSPEKSKPPISIDPQNPRYFSFRGKPLRSRLWRWATRLNERHPQFAWVSLFGVAITDLYIRLCAMGVWSDLRII